MCYIFKKLAKHKMAALKLTFIEEYLRELITSSCKLVVPDGSFPGSEEQCLLHVIGYE
jgi:hypothetical protein